MNPFSSGIECCGHVRIRVTCDNGIFTLTTTSSDGTIISQSVLGEYNPLLAVFDQFALADCESSGLIYVACGPVSCPGTISSSSGSHFYYEYVASGGLSIGGGVPTVTYPACCTTCPGLQLPLTLYATFSDPTGNCAGCLPTTSVPMYGSLDDTGCVSSYFLQWSSSCATDYFATLIGCPWSLDDGDTCGGDATSITCDPFQIVIAYVVNSVPCGLCTGTFNVTITE